MKKRVILSVLGIALISSVAANISGVPSDEAKFIPSSSSQTFDKAQYKSFADYIAQTKNRLQADKVYMDESQQKLELATASPYEIQPDTHCSLEKTKGILLIHGLSDMPFAMQDMANSFAERCFLVRSILLPGHGTRAADLMKVARQDWLEAARFGVETLKAEVDEVYIGGFSLGGLISAYLTAEDSEIQGAFLVSPSLKIKRNLAISQSVWVQHFVQWADTDAQDDYARYESMPMHGLAEIYQLTQDFKHLLEKQPIKQPIFLVQSDDDGIIDTQQNKAYFSQWMSSAYSKALVYKQKSEEGADLKDARITYKNSYLPSHKVLNFSHQAVHTSPQNTHYGQQGTYRNCGVNSSSRSVQEADACLSATKPWQGETVGTDKVMVTGEPLMRLTYNPLYGGMFKHIDQFLAAKL